MTRPRAAQRLVAVVRGHPRAPRAAMLAVAAALAAATLSGCATTPAASPDAPRSVSGQPLAPHAMHEECMPLAAGDRLDYRFTSSAPVGFNIHYRDQNAVVIPIAREAVTADSGIFQPALPQEYCLTWEAGGAGATLEYRFAVRRRGP